MKNVKKPERLHRRIFASLPERKKHLEFFTALLSIPVLITVIIPLLSRQPKSRLHNHQVFKLPAKKNLVLLRLRLLKRMKW